MSNGSRHVAIVQTPNLATTQPPLIFFFSFSSHQPHSSEQHQRPWLQGTQERNTQNSRNRTSSLPITVNRSTLSTSTAPSTNAVASCSLPKLRLLSSVKRARYFLRRPFQAPLGTKKENCLHTTKKSCEGNTPLPLSSDMAVLTLSIHLLNTPCEFLADVTTVTTRRRNRLHHRRLRRHQQHHHYSATNNRRRTH